MVPDRTSRHHDVDSLLAELAVWGLSVHRHRPTVDVGRPVVLAMRDDEWATFVATVAGQRISGLLVAAVEAGAIDVSEAHYRGLLDSLREQLRTCLLIEEHLLEIASVLDGAGVEMRVLKGSAVAHLDFPDPSMRVFNDIDVLVRPEQLDAAIEAICRTGARRRFPELRPGFDRRFAKGVELYADGRPEIDLHRTFSMGPFGLWIDLDDLWSTSEHFELAGRRFEALDSSGRFLHACYHVALGGERPRLSQLRDVLQLLERPTDRDTASPRPDAATPDGVNVGAVLARARAWRGEPVVARAIEMVWDHLHLDDTALSSWARRYEPTASEARALRSTVDPTVGYAARCLSAWVAVPGPRDKAAFAWALAFPSKEFGAGRHSGRGERWRRAFGDARRLVSRPASVPSTPPDGGPS